MFYAKESYTKTKKDCRTQPVNNKQYYKTHLAALTQVVQELLSNYTTNQLFAEIAVTWKGEKEDKPTQSLLQILNLLETLELRTGLYELRIIPYVMTWDGIVTNYHKQYRKELKIDDRVEAYVQSRVLKMTLESLSMDARRGGTNTDETNIRDEERWTTVEGGSEALAVPVSEK